MKKTIAAVIIFGAIIALEAFQIHSVNPSSTQEADRIDQLNRAYAAQNFQNALLRERVTALEKGVQ